VIVQTGDRAVAITIVCSVELRASDRDLKNRIQGLENRPISLRDLVVQVLGLSRVDGENECIRNRLGSEVVCASSSCVVVDVEGRIIEAGGAKIARGFQARFPFVSVSPQLIFRLVAAYRKEWLAGRLL